MSKLKSSLPLLLPPSATVAARSWNLGALRQTIPVSKHQALFGVRIVGYAYEFDHGFVWQADDVEPQTYRWDGVATVNWYASQHYVNGAYSGTQFWINLTSSDGRNLKMSGSCKDPTAKGARRADPQAAGYVLFQFLTRVRDAVSATQLPHAIAALSRGERLSFGDLFISSAGIQTPKGFVPWPSIKAVNVIQGRVSVRQEGKFLALSSKGVEQIPNYPLFLTLAQTLTRQATSGGSTGA
jgi:Family of unknown function (DUF6585)